MKPLSFITFLLSLLLGSMSLTSCGGGGGGDEPAPKPPTPPTPSASVTITGEAAKGLNFPANGGSKQLTFTASGAWTVSVASTGGTKWCKVSPASGSETSASVAVTVDSNTGYDDRSVSVTVACGSVKKTVVVTQKQANAILVTSDKVEMPSTGGNFTAEVKANVDYNVTIPEQFSGWLSKSSNRALVSTHVTFTVAQNESLDRREGYVLFSGSGIEEKVNVYQAGEDAGLVLSTKAVSVPAEGEAFKVELRSNCDFTVEMPDVDWLRRDESRAMSSHTLWFVVSPWEGKENSRMAKIVFRSVDGSASETLEVTQLPKGAIAISAREIKVSNSGEVFSLRFASNVNPSTTIFDNGDKWIEPRMKPSARAMEEKELWFEAKPNSDSEPRSARIVISQYKNPEVADTVRVLQEGSYFSFTSSVRKGDFTDAMGHDFTVDVNTNIAYKLSYSEFIEQIEDETGSKSHLKFRIMPNYTEGESRVGAINFLAGDKLLGLLTVSQEAPKVNLKNNAYETDYKGGKIRLDMTSNLEIEVTVAQQYASWISVREPEAGSFVPEISVAENTTPDNRSAVISLAAGTYWKRAVSIKQSGKPVPLETVTVTIPEGESLAETLTEEQAMEVESITIDGGIDGGDIDLLRKMATEGKLTELDLSATTIEKSAEGYSTIYGPRYIEKDNCIGEYMFHNTKIKRIVLPSNLEEISKNGFYCSAIEEIEVPKGVTKIGRSAFDKCYGLKHASIPGTVAELPADCFMTTPNLESVSLGEGMEVIGENAFFHYPTTDSNGKPVLASKLREVNIPSTVKEIKNSAFQSSGIETVAIPSSVTAMGESSFLNCIELRKVVIDGVPNDGVLPDHSFFQCHSLSDIRLPEGLKVIGKGAFACVSARELVLPGTVVEIREGAFNQTDFHKLELPEGLEIIGDYAFSQMWRLPSITLPSTVKSIGKNLFNCTVNSLKAIHCRMTVPPATAGPLVNTVTFDFKTCTLYVPVGSKEAYSKAQYWSDFTNIVEE